MNFKDTFLYFPTHYSRDDFRADMRVPKASSPVGIAAAATQQTLAVRNGVWHARRRFAVISGAYFSDRLDFIVMFPSPCRTPR